MAVIGRLGSVQFDPLGVAGRNHDLVLHARVAGYRPAWTDELLYERRVLVRGATTSRSPSCRSGSCPGTASAGTGPWSATRATRSWRTPTSPGTSWSGSGRRARSARWTSSASRWSTGTGAPPIACGPSWRRSGSRACWGLSRRAGNRRYYDLPGAAVPGGAAGRVAHPRRTSSCATSCCHATGRTACSGEAGQAEIWLGVHVRRADGRRAGGPTPGPPASRAGRLGRPAGGGRRGRAGNALRAGRGARGAGAGAGEVAAGAPPGGADPGVTFLAPLDPLLLGPRPAAPALRLRLRVGGLRARGPPALGLLRAARCSSGTGWSDGSSRGSTGRRAP